MAQLRERSVAGQAMALTDDPGEALLVAVLLLAAEDLRQVVRGIRPVGVPSRGADRERTELVLSACAILGAAGLDVERIVTQADSKEKDHDRTN